MTTTTTTTSNAYPEIQLQTIHCNGRDIDYSTVGDEKATPILFFYPGGANRRMIASWRDELPQRLICVNRPGKGGTSPAKGDNLSTAVEDVICVLDSLGLDRVSVLCMCAGTTFAMAFCLKHPERTTGQFMGVSSWVQPADCGYKNTKLSFYLGTHVPLISPLVGSIMSSIGMSMTSLPVNWVTGALRGKLSAEEQEVFDVKFKDGQAFIDQMKWMQEESGGQGDDVRVLLSGGLIDYEKLGQSQKVVLWHGTNDSMVRFSGAEWLAKEIPGSVLNAIPDGSHEGLMFGLHPSIVDAMKSLGN